MESKVSEAMWNIVQKQLEYNDDEMKLFRKNQRNESAISKLHLLINMKFVFEIVESHGCGCKHRKGDRIYFDGLGQLITELSPKRICAFTISAVSQLIFTAQELVYAGVDPSEMRLNRVGCYDVGINCGGWGNVVLEIAVENLSLKNE
jgi:uncharacterized repeat protein (TIGR04076 family)